MSSDDARGVERELLAEALVQVDLTVFGSPQHNHDDAYLAVANILLASPQFARLIEQREAAARAEAWDEGYEAGHDDEANARWDIGANPYRDRIEQGAGE